MKIVGFLLFLVGLLISATESLTSVEIATAFCANQPVGRYTYDGDET